MLVERLGRALLRPYYAVRRPDSCQEVQGPRENSRTAAAVTSGWCTVPDLRASRASARPSSAPGRRASRRRGSGGPRCLPRAPLRRRPWPAPGESVRAGGVRHGGEVDCPESNAVVAAEFGQAGLYCQARVGSRFRVARSGEQVGSVGGHGEDDPVDLQAPLRNPAGLGNADRPYSRSAV